MKARDLFWLINFVLVNSVYGKENDFKEARKNKAVETRYNLNHPPLEEYYNPTPVAIVYEDSSSYIKKSDAASKKDADESLKEIRKGIAELDHNLNPPLEESYNPMLVTTISEDNKNGSLKTDKPTVTEATKSKTNITVLVVGNENNNTTTKYEMYTNNAAKISVDNKTNEKLVAKPRNLNNLQIPVAVVYDSDYINYRSHPKRTTDMNLRLPTSRSNFSRKIETGEHRQKEQNVHESKDKTKNLLPPKVDTRVFKKRTGDRDPVVPILDMENYVFSHNGNFRYSYEGGDGTKAFSEGKQITIDDEAGESVVGGFSYKDKEGNDYSVTYTADENGYRPVGAHLPTPPPIPQAIARALKYLATATPDPENHTKRPDKA